MDEQVRLELALVDRTGLGEGGRDVGDGAVEGEALGIRPRCGCTWRGRPPRRRSERRHGLLEGGPLLRWEGDRLEERQGRPWWTARGRRGSRRHHLGDGEPLAVEGEDLGARSTGRPCARRRRRAPRGRPARSSSTERPPPRRARRRPPAPSEGVAMTPIARPCCSTRGTGRTWGGRPGRRPPRPRPGGHRRGGRRPGTRARRSRGRRPARAEVAHADDGDRPVLGEPERRGDLGGEPLDVDPTPLRRRSRGATGPCAAWPSSLRRRWPAPPEPTETMPAGPGP